jgi:hypothetical protein
MPAVIFGATAVPQVVLIAWTPAYLMEFAGTWSGGQFLGNVSSQTDVVAWAAGDPTNSRRWFAYQHEFDCEGNYLKSAVECPR